MKRVLLFYPPNKRSVAIETLCKAVHESGNELMILTLTPKGPFHEMLEGNGVKTFSIPQTHNRSWKYLRFFKQSRFLIRFCRQHNIDTVWSHLQEANIITIMAQRSLKAKVVLFRHHAESAFYAEFGKKMNLKRSRGEVILDKIINRFGKIIVVPSSGVWYGMEKYERCKMNKVKLIPYIYDFSTYQKPDAGKLRSLKDKYPCSLMLIMVSRMVASKQHGLVFEIVNKLVKEGLSIKMIVMDDGPLRPELEKFIAENNLGDHIIMTGFQDDFVNYMAAADLLIHPSVTEASNNVVKELALLEKAVAVCRHVGDFSDYIEDDRNGYFLERNDLEKTIETVIRDGYANPDKLKRFGAELKKDVLREFSDSTANRQRFLDLLN
ncbi:MAG: glycosyltransferase family 4 protein [Chitinophagaceae bacterium]|nr:glycosyltransferase family 4 protein [Chitinophagaceae bacterium]